MQFFIFINEFILGPLFVSVKQIFLHQVQHNLGLVKKDIGQLVTTSSFCTSDRVSTSHFSFEANF